MPPQDKSTVREAQRGYLTKVMTEAGIDLSNIARLARLATTTLTRFYNSDDSAHALRASTIAKISAATGVEAPPFILPPKAQDLPTDIHPANAFNPRTGMPIAPPGQSMIRRDLPIMGQAKAGSDGFTFDNDLVDSFVERPWFLADNASAYGIYVNGDSMEPVLSHGHLVYANPTIPPRAGDDVIIGLEDGQGFIKRLLTINDDEVKVEQYNPASVLKFARQSVQTLHVVVATLRRPS